MCIIRYLYAWLIIIKFTVSQSLSPTQRYTYWKEKWRPTIRGTDLLNNILLVVENWAKIYQHNNYFIFHAGVRMISIQCGGWAQLVAYIMLYYVFKRKRVEVLFEICKYPFFFYFFAFLSEDADRFWSKKTNLSFLPFLIILLFSLQIYNML